MAANKSTSSLSSSHSIPPQWAQQSIISDPPRLYAWTPANLVDGPEVQDKLCHNHQVPRGSSSSYSNNDVKRRIYVLGVGNLGRLYASSLAKLPSRPPITLVVHRKGLLEHWIASPGIDMIRGGKLDHTEDFDIEWWTDDRPTSGPACEPGHGDPISNLIVATKAADAMPQVEKIGRYLSNQSTIAFVQNGMCKLWPPLRDAYERLWSPRSSSPNWIACVTTHGVTSMGTFKSVHASPATVAAGPVLLNSKTGQRADYLLSQIVNAPYLDGRQVSKPELWLAQVEKLVVNSVINPLTAILDCKNGEIFVDRHDELPHIINLLIREASEVLQALVLDPDVEEVLNDNTVAPGSIPVESSIITKDDLFKRFSVPMLRTMVLQVGEKVKENTSSMLQDYRAGKQTEIGDFNGWLLETAKHLDASFHLPTHERLIILVKKGLTIRRDELGQYFDVQT